MLLNRQRAGVRHERLVQPVNEEHGAEVPAEDFALAEAAEDGRPVGLLEGKLEGDVVARRRMPYLEVPAYEALDLVQRDHRVREDLESMRALSQELDDSVGKHLCRHVLEGAELGNGSALISACDEVVDQHVNPAVVEYSLPWRRKDGAIQDDRLTGNQSISLQLVERVFQELQQLPCVRLPSLAPCAIEVVSKLAVPFDLVLESP
mmetsp:Transcript_9327/g.31203  ORF Transcript_9327/g.31203 Transcript_9327/m.31203 type:complete len:206 (-) Transcript_9327:3046-3663(-)